MERSIGCLEAKFGGRLCQHDPVAGAGFPAAHPQSQR